MKLRYAVVYEQTPNNYGAYAPDVPGCVSAGETWEETREMIREALTIHLEDLLEEGEPLPEPRMSIDDAIARHSEPLPDHVLRSYGQFGEQQPTMSTTFQMVEVEIAIPDQARAI